MASKFSGNKIRVMRKERGMSIKELADASNLSSGLISQIERDLVSPSVNAMARIVDALNTTMGEFFEDDYIKEDPVFIKKGNHKIIAQEKTNQTYEILSPTDGRNLELTLVRLGKTEYPEKVVLKTHEGEECGVVISGKMIVEVDDVEYVLEKGDSIYLESTKPHRYLNPYDEECITVWGMSPPSY